MGIMMYCTVLRPIGEEVVVVVTKRKRKRVILLVIRFWDRDILICDRFILRTDIHSRVMSILEMKRFVSVQKYADAKCMPTPEQMRNVPLDGERSSGLESVGSEVACR